MTSRTKEIIQFITKKGSFQTKSFKDSIEKLQQLSSSGGLPEEDIDELVNYLTNTRLASENISSILYCLIPEVRISDKSLEAIIIWFFTQSKNEKLSSAVEKRFIQWLTGITQYELAETSIIDAYYHAFLFLLNKSHLESSVCRLICLLLKPEDANRWIVEQILNIQNIYNPKGHTNSLLSLIKSYRPDTVPEAVSLSTFNYKPSPFDECLSKAHSRKLNMEMKFSSKNHSNQLVWNNWNIYDERSKKLTRLIPAAENFNLENNKTKINKFQSLFDNNITASFGVSVLDPECPVQSLSLLINLSGYHLLAFSDITTKTRFFHKLYHTLCRELEPYSDKEKINFLRSIRGLQEYTQQSIPVVTMFLFDFLSAWDGEEYCYQILKLVEWIEVRGVGDLEKYVFPSLRQIFISSGTHCKCLIINTMGKLMMNLLVMDKREKNCFRNYFPEFHVIRVFEAISAFVAELITIGLIWSGEGKNKRNLLMTAIEFYETAQAIEQESDLPTIILMPPAVVYSCLFSCSRICIARLSSLLVRLQTNSIERLLSLGVYYDFASEVQKLNVYTLDCYRCLWSKLSFCSEEDSFIFGNKSFWNTCGKYTESHGPIINELFQVEFNSAFWNLKTRGHREILLSELADHFPSIVHLKLVTEERLLQQPH